MFREQGKNQVELGPSELMFTLVILLVGKNREAVIPAPISMRIMLLQQVAMIYSQEV
jgi:hypothetical protein